MAKLKDTLNPFEIEAGNNLLSSPTQETPETKVSQLSEGFDLKNVLSIVKMWTMPQFNFAEFMSEKASQGRINIKDRDFPVSLSYKKNVIEYFRDTVGCLEVTEEKRDRGRPLQMYRWHPEKLEHFFKRQ